MKILVVDDEKGVCFALEELFKTEEYDVKSVYNAEDAIKTLENNFFEIAIIDYQLPGMNGMDLLKHIKSNNPLIEVILMTGFGSDNIAVEAIKNKAYDFVSKPFNNEELVNRVNHIRNIIKERAKTPEGFGYYFSNEMKNIIDTIKTVAVIDAPLLITGDSGTGKELLAKLTHRYSERKGKFIPVNCSAIPESLIESEFFGSEKGSFTGSTSTKKGLFELADKGTIFLDEIGEMPLDTQVKLLRVLQEKEITRIGSGVPLKIDVRVIAATNRNIEEEVKNKSFREDLYYRLNVVRIKTKPLSERKDEIKPLSEIFLNEFNLKYSKKISGFSEKLIKDMENHKWNGNIRELRNKVENAVIFCKNDQITENYLNLESDKINNDISNSSTKSDYNFENLPDNITKAKRVIVEKFELAYISYYLEKNENNVKKTADQIGLSRQDLYKKIKELNLNH